MDDCLHTVMPLSMEFFQNSSELANLPNFPAKLKISQVHQNFKFKDLLSSDRGLLGVKSKFLARLGEFGMNF